MPDGTRDGKSVRQTVEFYNRETLKEAATAGATDAALTKDSHGPLSVDLRSTPHACITAGPHRLIDSIFERLRPRINQGIDVNTLDDPHIQNGSMTTNRSLRRTPPRRQRRLYQQLHFAASPAWDRRFELAVPFP